MRILLLLCLACGVAAADDEHAAKQAFSAGAKAYAAQNFRAAATYFDEAYKAQPMPEIAFSAAQAYRKLSRVETDDALKIAHVRRAVDLYRVYLDKVKTGGRVGDASDNLGEMERELERLDPKGKVQRVETAARTQFGFNINKADQATPDAGALREIGEGTGGALEGVVTKLDGKQIDPYALAEVPAGEHVIAVTADGYFPIEKKQRAIEGSTVIVDIELAPRPARVKVTTEAGARITVDGRPSGSSMLELATGKHVIAVLRRGRLPFGREISVVRGQELTLAAPLEKTTKRRAVPWVLGGAGSLAVLSALTGIAAVVADNHAIDARDQIAAGNASPALADEYDQQVRRRDELKTSAIVFGAGALVAGAVGFGLLLFDAPSPAKIELAPVVGRGTAGMSATRRF